MIKKILYNKLKLLSMLIIVLLFMVSVGTANGETQEEKIKRLYEEARESIEKVNEMLKNMAYQAAYEITLKKVIRSEQANKKFGKQEISNVKNGERYASKHSFIDGLISLVYQIFY